MPPRFLHLLVSLSCCLAACAPPAEEPGASEASGSEAAAGPAALPPPPPPEGAPPPAAVPPATPNTEAAAQVVPVADPITASPGIYEVVLDSPRMRILEGTWKPKQKDEPHGHPPLVAYALTDVDALSHGDDGGEAIKVKLRAGQAFFQNALHAHTLENVGKKPMKILIVELKQGVPPEPLPEDASPDALTASPDVYRKVFEDQHVRVLYASWEPGKMDDQHGHPGLAAYYLTDVHATLHERWGQSEDISQPAGSGFFHAAVRGHTFENIGKQTARMVLFEPKAPAFGAAGAGPGAGAAGGLPVESGKGEVSAFIDKKTGVMLDIGEGFTAEIPPGLRFSSVVTFSKTDDRPSSSSIAEGFTRHAATLVFDGTGSKLTSPVVIGIGIPRMPTRTGQKFVLAMESSVECTKQNKRWQLRDGGCSQWTIVPAEFDEARHKVVGRLTETGGFRLQFGWLPE